MSERFFVETPITGSACELTGDEARHASAVMRLGLGDQLVVFDGSGAEFLARVTAIAKHAVQLSIAERRELSRELNSELTLAVALPKGDRQKWLVEKATELGVTRLVPLVTERGVAQPVEAALARLARTVIEASKQCGRNRLLEIEPPQRAADYFQAAPRSAQRLLCDASGSRISAIPGAERQAVIAAIGPEGGFAPAEVAVATSAGWEVISFGPRILRVETAAIAVAAWAAMC